MLGSNGGAMHMLLVCMQSSESNNSRQSDNSLKNVEEAIPSKSFNLERKTLLFKEKYRLLISSQKRCISKVTEW